MRNGGSGVFERDDAWQKSVRDAVLAPGFYKKYATDGRYVVIDKGRLATLWQKRYAVDTIAQGKNGAAVCIEEKIVRWPGYHYASFCLETKSCTVPGFESPGWMFYGEADFLLYCFAVASSEGRTDEVEELNCWLIDFPKLQEWFWPREQNYPEFRNYNTINKSAGRKVLVKDVHRAVPAWQRKVKAEP